MSDAKPLLGTGQRGGVFVRTVEHQKCLSVGSVSDEKQQSAIQLSECELIFGCRP